MKLSKLLSALDISISVSDREIETLTENPSIATKNSLFVCIRGARANGHDFAPTAYENGCRVFVCSEPLTLPTDAQIFSVLDTRVALAKLAAQFYGHPSKAIRVVGVTGTKGKTTVASLCQQVLSASGIPCGYIGTNGVFYAKKSLALKNTTPDPITLQRTLRDMANEGMQAVILEVSSQAVYQSRIEGLEFEACIFTNLYSDHVGPSEHPSFDHYKACKHRLFTDYPCKTMICNADDPHTSDMRTNARAKRVIEYSMQRDSADFYAQNALPTLNQYGYGISFLLNHAYPVSLSLLGKFNASNALAVLAVASECFQISLERAICALSQAHVTGRTETVKLKSGAYAVVDYAHNGESLSKLLSALREYKPRRLICLFGSVGERSFLRRREMGDAAARLSDLTILTSDNPGKEDPMKIITEIAQSFASVKIPYLTIPDRAEAIRTAVGLAQEGDILVLAGKGHENYQLIGNQKLPFSDRNVLESCN